MRIAGSRNAFRRETVPGSRKPYVSKKEKSNDGAQRVPFSPREKPPPAESGFEFRRFPNFTP